ncbi:hypothetical protein MMC20_008051 [Loxospora ochrophaea]|nr:hypothetical protein [Loxospora ochrophaea]
MSPLLRVSRLGLSQAVRRHGASSQRAFTAPTATRQADLVQDLYLQALKAYKTPPTKPSDSEGHVQKFSMPKAPQSPEESDIATDLKAYEDQKVEVEGQAAAGETPTDEDWFEEEPEDETPAAH